jgi:MSHA pilin protein MshC
MSRAYLKIIKKQDGFTIIEVIAVFVIIGILAALSLSRIASTQSYTALSEVDILKMHLRYAQLRALSDDKTWGISFAGNTYTLLRDGSAAPYNLPNEASPTHTLPNEVTVSGATVTFDEWGSPGVSDIAITVSPGGGVVTIIKNTGFIP